MYRIVQQASLVIGYLLITGVALQAQITPDVGPPIIFVKPVADGSGDGSSWGNATDDLQAAINSPRVIQVWVAAGTYVAPGTGFVMKNGVEIYGGFPVSGNPVMDDRSLPASEETGGEGFEGFSVLSGEGAIRAIDNNFEGASALDNSAVLDGFVLTGGDAASLGGAIVNAHASPTLRHLLITGNSAANEGGGIYNSNSSPVLTDIIISGNEADEGGGMFNLYGEPTLTNVTISGNSAGDRGGGMYNLNGTPTLTNVMFTGNSAGGNGGGMINNNSGSLTLRNVMFTGNSALHGGGMYNFDSSPTLTNTIIWGNTAGGDGNEIYNQSGLVTLEYSLYGNKSNDIANPNDGDIDAGDHSLTVDPQFADPGNGDYSLLNISPAINAGDNSPFESGGVAEGITTDLAGNARIFDGATDIVDMGAYEFQGEPLQLSPDGNVLYVNQNVPSGNESGNSWTNASPGLTAPLVWAKTNWDADTDGQLQIWVAEGSYLPYELYTTGEAYYFEIPAGTTLLGGFEGNEAAAGERNWAGHPTILSGDLNGSGSANEGDSHTIVRIDADDVTVDGFSVEYGFADDGSTLPGRTGAGFYADQAENLVINNTIFRNLVADDGSGNGVGGAVIAFGGAMDISNSLFHDNEATFGGAVSLEGSAGLTLINATLAANNAGDNGGALNTNGNSVTIVNTVFAGNTSYGNKNINGTTTAINYSYLQGQNPAGTGNIDGTTVTDLLFIDSGNDDYTLQDSSPAINTGNNTAIPSGITTDLAGNDRIFDTTIDIGAYEFQGEPFSIGPDDDNILYVDKNVDTEASGYDGAGDSWTNAIPELADALKWAREQHEDDDTVWDSDPLQIWVAEGTYLPLYNAADGSYTEDGGRDNAFVLVPNVQLYGGFDPDGGIDDLSDERIFPTTSPGEGTILSGDLDGNDNPGDFNNHTENTYHVVLAPGAATGGLLDGFTVQGGNGNGNGSSSVTSLGSSFHRFDGGGIFNLSTLTVRNGRLTQNRVERSGGGAKGGGLINRGDVTLRNVMVSGNHSSGGEGGGLYGAGSGTVDLANVLVAGNTAAQGAGLAILDGTTTLANTTITSNAADANGGGLAIIDASVEAANSIIWGNTALNDPEVMDVSDSFSATYSIVGGGTGGGLDTVPLFADASGGDYTLLNTSPAINSGDPSTDLSLFTGGPDDPLDLAGNVRVFDGAADPDIIDIGAYEFQGEPVTIPEAVVLSTPSDEAVNVGLTPEFTWQPADGADEYHLQVSGNEEFSSTVIDDSGLTETTFEPASDLDNATTYYWRVRASNEAGDGEWSEVFSFTTLPESSEVVILTDPSDDAADVPLKPLFEWNTATGADTYDLVVSPNSDFSDPVVEEEAIDDTEFKATSDLGFSTMYYWQVRGVNAGGAGEWSEPFSFTTQDRPEAADNRILVANTESYTFTPAGFGQADNNFLVVIDDLPGGFSGTLELDDGSSSEDVETGDEISVGDIDDEKLIYTPPSGGVYGYGFDSFEFLIEDNAGNQSEQSYTMSLDVAATSVELDYDGEGWRFLASPADGETVGDFFEPIWTQGFDGSNSSTASFTNIQTLNQSEYEWEPVDHADDAGCRRCGYRLRVWG